MEIAEGEKRVPFQAEEPGYRIDHNADFVENAAFYASAKAVGQYEEHDRHQRDDPQSPEENVQCALKGHIEDIAEGGLVVGRQLHNEAHPFLLGARDLPNTL